MKNKLSIIVLSILTFTACDHAQKEKFMLYPDENVSIKYQQPWQIEIYKKRIEDFKKKPIGYNKIVFLGNSITEGGKDWNKKFGVNNISNRGISGDITEGVLERIDEIIFYKPSAVFILIGINDIFNSDLPERNKITPDYVSNNILSIATRISDNSPLTRIYIQTILPINDKLYEETKGWFPTHAIPLKVQINNINNLLKKKCQSSLFELVDLHSEFTDQEGLLNRLYTNDGVHLNDDGYRVWTNFIQNTINSLQE